MSALISMITLPFLIAGISPDVDRPEAEAAQATTDPVASVPHGEWIESFDDAQSFAAEKNIPILLHFEASWCGACRRMDRQVLNDVAVKAYFGKQIIGVRVDADRHRSLINRFGVATLPTEIVITPDGTEGARYVGAVSLQSYLSRLKLVAKKTSAADSTQIADSQKSDDTDSESEKTRTCLIVRRDGKIVGLGGFSPVAMSDHRKWQRGNEEFVVSFQDVEYFLQSAEEVARFEAKPEQFVPYLHGCDPVELHRSKLARAGAIEFGSFYKGEMFFFASLANRTRFQNNPAWYLRSGQQPNNDREAAELLDMIR